MIELNKIYNEDCLEGMKRIPDGSVDCIVCDRHSFQAYVERIFTHHKN